MAVLDTVPVFSVVVSLKDPLPERPTGNILFTESQVWLLLTFQDVLDVIFIVVEIPEAALGLKVVAFILRCGAAAWVTLIVRVVAPGAVTVMVPDLATPVLAVALILKDPAPVRVAGDMLSTRSHDVALLDTVIFHVRLDDTVTALLLAVCVGDHVARDKSSLGGCGA